MLIGVLRVLIFWWFALFQGGNLVTEDRWAGVLEWVLAVPVGFASVILGRIAAIMCFGLFGFFEVWGIGEAIFGVGEWVGDGGFVGLGEVDGLGEAVAVGHALADEDVVGETTSPHGPRRPMAGGETSAR